MVWSLLTIIILIYVSVGGIFTAWTYKNSFRRFKIHQDSPIRLYEYYKKDYPRREVSFPSGKETLRGYIYGGDNDKALIVFSHGIWSGEEEYIGIILSMVDHGFRVFAYDYTGYNNSTGKSSRGLPQAPLDLDAALTYIEHDNELKNLKKITMGHSWGAYASAAVLNFDHKIEGAVCLSGFDTPVKVSVSIAKLMIGPFGCLSAPFTRIFNLILFGKKSNLSAVEGINRSGIPVLISHADKDQYISYKDASISCEKDRITNPKARYYVITEEDRNSHERFLLSADSARAMKKIMDEWAEVEKPYKKKDKKALEAVRRDFFSKVDKEELNRPATQFFDMIASFCDEAVD